jgi:hypothetical protein
MPSPLANFARKNSLAFAVLAILALYGWEAHARRERMSTPASLGDQGAYLGYARQMYESGYTVIGDRNRMPGFPFLLSLIYRPGETEPQFLRRAQAFNVNLSIVLLLGLFLIFRRFFPPLYALALLAATAFGVFLYRAVNAQVEVVFYSVGFCAFVLFWSMLRAPRWWLAILCGLTMGLAHLSKASLLPALGIWTAVFAAQTLWKFRTGPADRFACLSRQLGLMFLVLASFAAVIHPYLRNSKRIYGQYFYNVNSAFVMWCDSSQEGWQFLDKWGDKDKWRALPTDELPSPAKYWREHSFGQIVYRVARGLRGLVFQNLGAIGYYKFAFALVLAGALLFARHRRRLYQLLAEQPFPAAFCVLFFAVNVLLYAWYDAIVNDTRFILSMFLPFVFAASILILALGTDRTVAWFGRRVPFSQFLAGLLLGLAVIDVLYNAARSLA